MRRNKRSERPGKRQGGKNSYEPIPMQLTEFGPVKRTIRYTVTNTSAAIAVGMDDLVFCGGAICTITNSQVRAVNTAAKLQRIRIWAPLSTTVAPSALSTSVVLLWGQGITSDTATPQMQIVSTTQSSVHPAYISSRPPKGSMASFWNTGTNGVNLFQIFSYGNVGQIVGVPVGTVIEVTLLLQPAVLGASNFRTISTGVLNQTYWLTLDNSGSAIALPVGLPSTV